MVSPCKNDDQNINVKFSYNIKKKAPPLKGAKVTKTKTNQFASKTFYLDLKNRKESAKLEGALKSLGAVVAVFLDRSVTHVISDRSSVTSGSSPLVYSPAASVSPSPNPSPCSSDRSLPRSRGAAMLERVSTFSNAGYLDPVSLAHQWRIPVLSLSKVWQEVTKVKLAQSVVNRSTKATLKVTSNFIKIESLSGTMTRRSYKHSTHNEEDILDSAIGGKSSILCNGHGPTRHSQEDLKIQCNGLSGGHRSCKLLSPSGSDVLPLPAQRRSTRRASASWCGSTRELSQLSPALSVALSPPASPTSPSDSELGVTLRPKGTLWLPIALIGTTAEEHGNGIRRRGGSDASLHSNESGKPRRKKLSPEEKLLQDNKDYFKMEVLNTKLRSSGHKLPNHVDSIILKKVPARSRKCRWTKSKPEVSVDYEALIEENKIMKMNGLKKPKKPRRSELMKLCDEAETFMFGESSRQSALSANSAASGDDSCDEEDDSKPKRKRRSAEVSTNDANDNYKLETTPARYRNHSVSDQVEATEEKFNASIITFSFQTVPSEEPWYDVFSRQDEGREHHFPVISDPANQLFLLPYEMPRPLPPRLEPINYYFKRRKRLKHIIAQNHPRKSPRCHASTLAIMSSLKRRKRRSSASTGISENELSPKKEDPLPMLPLTDDDDIEELALLDPADPDIGGGSATTASRRKKTEERVALCAAPAFTIEAEPADVVYLVSNMGELPSLPLPATKAKTPNGPRRRRKARVNRTGWDKVRQKQRKVAKGKNAPVNTGIEPENIVTSPRRTVNSSPPSVLPISTSVERVGKLNNTYCQRLVLKRRRRATADYSWTRKR